MDDRSLSTIIQEETAKGNICFFAEPEHLVTVSIEEFIQQPVEGILYDLNRDDVTCLHWIGQGDIKWVNNYAIAQVVKYLMKQLDKEM